MGAAIDSGGPACRFNGPEMLQNGIQNQKDVEESGKLSYKWIESQPQ